MRGKKAREQKRDAKIKGNIVEQIVEQMHRVRGVVVERNARLPSLHTPNRRREIDVLVTGQVLDYEVRFAFECKNYDRPVDVAKIGELADKLLDVGIPPQYGVFVSASGFTAGALDRAKQLGMRSLLLAGLSEDRLGSAAIDALQSLVYLLPVVTEWSVVNHAATVKPEEMWVWFDADGRPVAQMPDLLWHRWRDGAPPSEIGLHEVGVEAPEWSQRVDGEPTMPFDVRFKVHVIGLVITVAGQANDHALVNAFNRQVQKRQVKVKFDTQPGNISMRVFTTEQAFDEFMRARPEVVKVLTRVRLPRLRWGDVFWPISERVHRKLEELAKSAQPGETISAEDFAALEQDPAASIWEPPAAIPPKPGVR